MPFPSSEEGLESLLVIQPHLSWSGEGGELHPGPAAAPMEEDSRQEGGGEDRDLVRLQETPGDSCRPSVVWTSTYLQLWDDRGPGLAPDPGGPGISDPTDLLLVH